MSEPIILELQRLSADGSRAIDDLLRKALIVATKLGIEDFKDWISRELHGYQAGADVPKYRKVRAKIQAVNTVQGRRIPFYLPDELREVLCNVSVTQAIGTLLELQRLDGAEFSMPLRPNEEQALLDGQGEFPMEPVRSVSRIEVAKIIDAVRTTILEWAIQLEGEGILGEGISFSGEEKEKAASSTNIHIDNFQGILGDVSQSTVSQNLKMEITPGDFDSLKRHLIGHGINETDISELKTAIDADPATGNADNFGAKVSQWMGQMIEKAASGVWEVGVGAAGGILGTAIAAYYGIGG